jgi:hypothetical protein
MDTEITIPLEEYTSLGRQARMYRALEAGGVDNWEGCHEALKEFYKDEDEEDGD